MIQRQIAQFRSEQLAPQQTGFYPNVIDNSILSGPTPNYFWAYRTAGAYLQDQVPLQPNGLANWSIVGLTITAYLIGYTDTRAATFGKPYGKLSRVQGAVLPTGGIQTSYSGNVSYVPKLILPPDTSMLFDIWNPDTDPDPPLWLNNATPSGPSDPTGALPISGSFAPTNPIRLRPGAPLYVGLYLFPRLACNLWSEVWGAQYTLTYDDGLPEENAIA